jgi:hypothetical protein
MAESFEEYVGRIEGYLEGRDPMRILRETPGRLARRVAGVPRRSLTAAPAPGKWTVGQIIAHLSEIELLWGYRVRTMLERDDPEIVGMDQEVWARVGRYERRDPAASLALFTELRRSHVALLRTLTPRELSRHGRHSQFGKLTISRIARLLAGHDINHGRQIEAILKAKSGHGRV